MEEEKWRKKDGGRKMEEERWKKDGGRKVVERWWKRECRKKNGKKRDEFTKGVVVGEGGGNGSVRWKGVGKPLQAQPHLLIV